MNPAKGPRKLMTFAQAQRELGMSGPGGRRLKRLVLGREKATGHRIAIRGGTRQPTYRVTMSALRRHLPELFPSKVDELERTMRTYLEGIDERIANRVSDHVAEHLEPRLDELWQRDEVIARNMQELTRRVARITGATIDHNRPKPTASEPVE